MNIIGTIKNILFTVDWQFFLQCSIPSGIFLLIIGLLLLFKKFFISKNKREFLDMGEHEQKKMIPSMGGLAFYAILPILYILYEGSMKFLFIAITTGLSGFIGAIDDWYKIYRGGGLSVKIKFLLQMLCAITSGIFFYYFFPHETYINFFGCHFNLGAGYIFWIAWVIMSTTHAVNLIDGIDGLAISQMSIMQVFSPLSLLSKKLSIILAMLWYQFFIVNRYKAKIFMGDVGAFFLGGYLASTFIIGRCELLLIITAIVLVINTMMVIIQTIYYRLYKMRFFSFTPYHHALEKKGWSENKICITYGLITLIGSLCSLLLYCRYYQ